MYNQYGYDPYQQRLQAMQRHEIIQVNGRAGAEAYRMAPNSSCLLLDNTAPLVWLCQSDGAGYHTATPYKIEAVTPQPEPSYRDLEARLNRLEEIINGQSDVSNVKQDAVTE